MSRTLKSCFDLVSQDPPETNGGRLYFFHLCQKNILYDYSWCNEVTVVVYGKISNHSCRMKSTLASLVSLLTTSISPNFPPVFFKLDQEMFTLWKRRICLECIMFQFLQGNFQDVLLTLGNQIPDPAWREPWGDGHMNHLMDLGSNSQKKSSIPQVGNSTLNISCLYCIRI